MLINEEIQVINNLPFSPEVNIKSSCIIVDNVYLAHIYILCFVTAELSCRESRV